VFSHFVWGTKLKSAGIAKTTTDSLGHICYEFAVPDSFMADGGSHFRNKLVDEFCNANNIKHVTTPSHSLWVNGLIEGTNKIFLGILKRLCAPDHDTTEGDVNPEDIPLNWPEYFETAIRMMNDRILVALKATPHELLFSRSFTPEQQAPALPAPTSASDVDIHFALADSVQWSAHLKSLHRAAQQKSSFDTNAHIVKFKSVMWCSGTTPRPIATRSLSTNLCRAGPHLYRFMRHSLILFLFVISMAFR
jgi:hypothetical protein